MKAFLRNRYLLRHLLKNISPVEVRCIAQGDSTIAPWLVSKVFGGLTDTQAEALAIDLETEIRTWNAGTTDEARESLRAVLGLIK